tara:strand:- start:3359 stop:3928 length:570 start_codon:yes stop_codon:yes gene_type:complete
MNRGKYITLYLILLFLSCQENTSYQPVDVKKEIAELKTKSEKISYLEKIYKIDQDIRDGKSSDLILKYGIESPEILEFYSKMDSIDKLNLERIEIYLKEFGYPDSTYVKIEAKIAPWLVIQHSTDIDKRKQFFPILYTAYNEGNIDTDQIEMYLGRTYQMVFGKYPFGEGAYDPNEKINRLIKELNLKK